MQLNDQTLYDTANKFLHAHDNEPWELVTACRAVRIARAYKDPQALSLAVDNLRKVWNKCIATSVTI